MSTSVNNFRIPIFQLIHFLSLSHFSQPSTSPSHSPSVSPTDYPTASPSHSPTKGVSTFSTSCAQFEDTKRYRYSSSFPVTCSNHSLPSLYLIILFLFLLQTSNSRHQAQVIHLRCPHRLNQASQVNPRLNLHLNLQSLLHRLLVICPQVNHRLSHQSAWNRLNYPRNIRLVHLQRR